MMTDRKPVDFDVICPKMVQTPRPLKKRMADNESEWIEYDTMLEENKTVFNYEIKKHGDKNEEYCSNCIKATELLW